MSNSIVRVIDAKSGKLKRYEDSDGKALAIVKGKDLVLTDTGRRQGFEVRGRKLYVSGARYPAF